MAKLYFRHGTVGSAKTLNLLAVAHNYKQQNKKVVLMKPELDTRFSFENISSRAGLSMPADFFLTENTDLNFESLIGTQCILVDESQFLSPHVIQQLRALSRDLDIPVICYGLRTDFKTNLFPGSQRLLELADTIEEIKTTCYNCNRKAIYNLKFVNGKPTQDGPVIDLGAEEKYLPACAKCYFS